MASAITITATTPANTSGTILRCRPFVKRYPKFWTPIRIPTVAREIVDTATTRSPARMTGPARGNSTAQKRRHAP